MKVFILYAHPEPDASFQAELHRRGVETLKSEGHEVVVSDLYKMGFNPVASADDFSIRRFPERLQYDREQKFAVDNDALPEDIKAELEKIFWCDFFIVQFPLYWFSTPAILKGWFDRVFVNSVVYGAGKRYETGGLKGRKAMVVTSCGAYPEMFEPDGVMGDINVALWHLHNGTLFYTGFEVLPAFVAYSPVFLGQEACDKYLNDYSTRLKNIDTTMPMKFHPLTDFGSDFKLKPDVTPLSAGHRR
ncbi:MAG: NAD(P)H dehydrogenase (quinone) [Paraglaciecola sp.]|jgi:NAD(P)H dehydrogenase (quinone)|uniref:NAD(P)H-dependent oxidoreductase n=1 Tax=uncultured Paraglaciecola sp. TaxID=1765024 RepID=UPI0025ECD627|nr:NAD(P)H-dependent oxidoreductase [uncultured Paraglaciecola sp.]